MRTATGLTWDQLRGLTYAVEHGRDFSGDQRRQAAKEGAALSDGSFPIYNQGDADNAARDIGRTKHPRSEVTAHIRKRVKALGLKMPASANDHDADD